MRWGQAPTSKMYLRALRLACHLGGTGIIIKFQKRKLRPRTSVSKWLSLSRSNPGLVILVAKPTLGPTAWRRTGLVH